jgi:hypothetical protein
MAVFWVVAPYILVEVYQCFRGPCCLHHLMMEAIRTSETLVNCYQTTLRYNPEDSHLHTRHRENFKSYPSLALNLSNYQTRVKFLNSFWPYWFFNSTFILNYYLHDCTKTITLNECTGQSISILLSIWQKACWNYILLTFMNWPLWNVLGNTKTCSILF